MDNNNSKPAQGFGKEGRFPEFRPFANVTRVPYTNEMTNRFSVFAPFPLDITPPRMIRTQSDAYVDHFKDLKRKREEKEEAKSGQSSQETELIGRVCFYEFKMGKYTIKIYEDDEGLIDHEIYEGDVQVIDF